MFGWVPVYGSLAEYSWIGVVGDPGVDNFLSSL